MKGAAAHRIRTGEEVIIMGLELVDAPLTPRIALVDGHNRIERML